MQKTLYSVFFNKGIEKSESKCYNMSSYICVWGSLSDTSIQKGKAVSDTILEYKCPCCGGVIEFNSKLQKMKCPYCDTEFDVETLKDYDEALKGDKADDDINWQESEAREWSDEETDGMSVYVCKSCGGEIIADDTTGATACPFCGNPVVIMGKFAVDLKPDYVIPFKYDKKAAMDAYRKYVTGKKLLPKVFAEENHIDEIKGVYVPFWLFDAEADGNVRYKATKVRVWSDSNYNYTETLHFAVLREGQLVFEHVPVDGSEKMADELMETIEPYDFSEAVDFQTAYLSGFLANRYDVAADKCIERANERIKQSTEDAFRSTVKGYATLIKESSSISVAKGSRRYALYPVWLLNTTWEGEQYTFAMNGQTGKFVGNLPVDKKASNKYLLGFTAVATAVVFGVMYLLGFIG